MPRQSWQINKPTSKQIGIVIIEKDSRPIDIAMNFVPEERLFQEAIILSKSNDNRGNGNNKDVMVTDEET